MPRWVKAKDAVARGAISPAPGQVDDAIQHQRRSVVDSLRKMSDAICPPRVGVVLLNLGGVRSGGELAPERIDPIADRGGGRVANRSGQLGDPREAPAIDSPIHGRDRPLA